MSIRTDLAYESYTSGGGDSIPGVTVTEEHHSLFASHTVTIDSIEGEKALGKPRGRYTTLELAENYKYDPKGFDTLLAAFSEIARDYLPPSGTCLVAGLGNMAVTADAIGPEVLKDILVTRHLCDHLPKEFGHLRKVAVIAPGVLGTTGMESGDVVAAIIHQIQPDFLVVIDALAAGDPSRLLTTLQICDTGLVPGSGVGNARASLTPETLGIPVIAIGVPTVIHAETFLAGKGLSPDPALDGMVLTPKEIDQAVNDLSKLIGYGLNVSLHPGLSLSDVEHFLS